MYFALIADDFTSHWVQSHNLFNFVAKHFDTDCELLVHRNNFDRIATNAEGATLKGDVISLVLNIHKPTQKGVAFDLIAHLDMDHAIDIFLRCSKAVDTRNCGNNDYIAPGEK